MKLTIGLILIVIIKIMSSCQSDVHKRCFKDLAEDNLPLFLSNGEILNSTFYNSESIYLYREAFERGPASCIQFNLKNDSIIFYEFDLYKEFYDNYAERLVFSKRCKNPSVDVKYLKIKNKYSMPNLKKVHEFSRKKEIKFLNKNPTADLRFRYFILLPRENIIYEIKMDQKGEHHDKNVRNMVDWIKKITKQISYKEELYFKYFADPSKTSRKFWSDYFGDSEFYKKIDSVNYAIPCSELNLFMPGNIRKSER